MLNQPNAGDAAAQGFQQGQRIAIERRRAQLEQEQMAAQRDLFRAQAAAAQSAYPQSVAPTAAGPDYGKIWLAAARPRMHLFADFDAKVFSPETAISPDMVMFMSSSPYAADLAYHFATHRAEAMAVYKLSPLEAARVIDRIERDIKAAANEVAKP